MDALSIMGLEKRFKKGRKGMLYALRGIDLRVAPGEIYGVLGPNGSGKSTLVRIVATLLLPDAGEVRVFGHDVVCDARRVRALVHRVSTEAAFFKKLSPLENLLYGARLYGIPGRSAAKRARALLVQLGLPPDRMGRPMEQLSRGQQQKVAIARLLHQQADLLLLDEPTRGIDVGTKAEIYRLIGQLAAQGKAILMVSSYLPELMNVCDTIGVMCRGRLVEVRPADQWTEEEVMHRATGREAA